MKLIKTSEATGQALDWLVTVAQGLDHFIANGRIYVRQPGFDDPDEPFYGAYQYSPSRLWSQGGPIIEREKISTVCCDHLGEWKAEDRFDKAAYGPTSLVAAMRCYVASKLGDEVEIPEELE